MTNDLESGLRTALAHRAAATPPGIVERLNQVNYHPRAHSAATASVVGGAAIAVGATSAYLMANGGSTPNHHAASHDVAAARTVHLAGYSFKLPEGVTASSGSCAPNPPPTSGTPETVSQAGGEFVAIGGGCLNMNLSADPVPANAVPVTVGTYDGFALADQPGGTTTLYVDVATNNNFVLTATGTGQTVDQLIELAKGGLPPCSPDREDAPTCN